MVTLNCCFLPPRHPPQKSLPSRSSNTVHQSSSRVSSTALCYTWGFVSLLVHTLLLASSIPVPMPHSSLEDAQWGESGLGLEAAALSLRLALEVETSSFRHTEGLNILKLPSNHSHPPPPP